MLVPIWKDAIVDLGLLDTLYYRITLAATGEVIYSGKSHRRPGEEFNSVRINDVCADWLANVLPALGQAEFTRLVSPEIYVQSSEDGVTWINQGAFKFQNDWSYDYGYNPATMGMAFPVTGRVDVRMPIVWTGVEVSEVVASVFFRDGTSVQVIIPVEISDDFNDDFNNDFAQSVRTAGSGTAVFLLSAWEDVDRIVVGGTTYKVVTECARYALYYVNAYGGWDCLLIEGGHKEEDTLKRHTREVAYDNRDIANRGVYNYVNEVTKRYTLHTGWLLGEQGEMMHHVIESTDVYLYDIPAGRMIPVTIPSTTCEYKTFRNQGNQLVAYALEVEEAHSRIRR